MFEIILGGEQKVIWSQSIVDLPYQGSMALPESGTWDLPIHTTGKRRPKHNTGTFPVNPLGKRTIQGSVGRHNHNYHTEYNNYCRKPLQKTSP